MGVIQNCTLAYIFSLKKNHAAIALHKTIEADDAGICHSIKIIF